MNKDTPGPWFVGAQNDALYVIDRRPANDNDHPNHGADTEIVAKPYPARGCTAESNARLIAAAPDLLEALQAAEGAMRNKHFAAEVLAHDSVVREMIRAAIAKATGDEA